MLRAELSSFEMADETAQGQAFQNTALNRDEIFLGQDRVKIISCSIRAPARFEKIQTGKADGRNHVALDPGVFAVERRGQR